MTGPAASDMIAHRYAEEIKPFNTPSDVG